MNGLLQISFGHLVLRVSRLRAWLRLLLFLLDQGVDFSVAFLQVIDDTVFLLHLLVNVLELILNLPGVQLDLAHLHVQRRELLLEFLFFVQVLHRSLLLDTYLLKLLVLVFKLGQEHLLVLDLVLQFHNGLDIEVSLKLSFEFPDLFLHVEGSLLSAFQFFLLLH